MDKDEEGKLILNVVFYKTESGKKPVREWLKDMPKKIVKPLTKTSKPHNMVGR